MKVEFVPRYTKYLCWYRTEIEKERSCSFLRLFSLVLILIIIAIVFSFKSCSKKLSPVYACHFSEKEVKYISEFVKHGSPNPIEMGIAVAKTKNPDLMTAIALKESNGNPKAIGDGNASKGAFQVQAKHWGTVPNTATEQALQAEKILEELVQSSRGRLRSGLAKYNGGDKPSRVAFSYADKVIKLAKEIKKC
jgi:hypothetical protein